METEVRHDPERSRYELVAEGRVIGRADYRTSGRLEVFHHTEIEPALQGRGLGAVLVRGALDDVRRRGARIIPSCWYVAEYIAEHPDDADLVGQEERAAR